MPLSRSESARRRNDDDASESNKRHLMRHNQLSSSNHTSPTNDRLQQQQQHVASSQQQEQVRQLSELDLSAFKPKYTIDSERSQVLHQNETFPLGRLFDANSDTSPSGLPSNQSDYSVHCLNGSSTDHIGHECFEDGTSFSITSFTNCNTSDSQLLFRDISSRELNFSSINEVWYVKSWQEISLRVSIVAPIVLLGLIGNLTIIYWMCRFKPIRSRPTNIFILNMALADLLTSIFCPNAALLTDIFQFYVLGAFVCRFEGFVKITCLLVSAYSLIVLSFDWFLCVVKPCRRRISIKQSWLTLAGIWIVSLVAASPLLYWRNLRERQWNDLVEVWCCEHIQYTKFYWVGMTLFLIYLPTFIMTIVLVVILVQMDKFEAKLKRTRCNSTTTTRTMSSASVSTDLTYMAPTSSNASVTSIGLHSGPSSLNNSLSISMKYRRRIVKILFFYLLTSIVCWTPLQFVIVYRHFRAEAVPASWFFELAFWSQLCASLSAALNPIIFGFLSQPFRRILTKSWMFRFCDKFCKRKSVRNQNNENNGKANQLAMANRGLQRAGQADRANDHNAIGKRNLNQPQARNNLRSGPDLEPAKLTLDYIEPMQMSSRDQTVARSSKRISTISSGHLSRQRAPNAGGTHHHRHNHHKHHHHRKSHIDNPMHSINMNREATPQAKVHRSHSSRRINNNVETDNRELSTINNKRVSFHDNDAAQSNNTSRQSGGIENSAYLEDAIQQLGDHEMEVRGNNHLADSKGRRLNGLSLSNDNSGRDDKENDKV